MQRGNLNDLQAFVAVARERSFTRAAAQTVFQLQTIDRWGFDPEILFIALKRGFRIVEVPVSWAHDERTRIAAGHATSHADHAMMGACPSPARSAVPASR